MKLKKYKCKECGKTYCSWGWVLFHVRKTNHRKFKRLNEQKFISGI